MGDKTSYDCSTEPYAVSLRRFAASPFLDKSERPIWLQLYDRLKSWIKHEDMSAGTQLPGENRLAADFGVNRITLRHALAHLQREGYLSARKGSGLFVRHRPTRYRVSADKGFLSNIEDDASLYSVRTIELLRQRAPPEIAARLGLPKSTRVIRVDRVRLRDSQPIYRTLKYFPAARFPNFEEVYAETVSVQAVFRMHGILKFRRTSTQVSGGFATSEEASALDLTPSTPVLRTVSSNADKVGTIIEYSFGTWPLTMIELVFSDGRER